jgi:hypothetical protein
MAGKPVGSFDEFMALAAPVIGSVDVRGRKVHIRELSDRQRKEIAEASKESQEECLAAVLAFGVVDGSGNPLMTRDQAREYGSSSPGVIQEISEAIMKLSGVQDEEGQDPGKD